MTMLVIFASLTVIGGLSFFSLQEVVVNRASVRAIDAQMIAESGIEDALYRIASGKNIDSSETLETDRGTAAVTVTAAGTTRTIRSETTRNGVRQAMEVFLDIAAVADGAFHFGVQVGDGGLEMANNSSVAGGAYSNGPITGSNGATIGGDAFAAGASAIRSVSVSGNAQAHLIDNATVGGYASSTTKIDDTVVAKDAHADELDDAVVNKDAYYNVIDAQSTVLGSRITPATPPPDLAPLPLPIAQAVIDRWKSDALAGGECARKSNPDPELGECDLSGNFILSNGGSARLGTKKIPGNLELDNGSTLTLTGTVWVAGKIKLSNNCIVGLDPGYASSSGVIITDGNLTISNNCIFRGSGDPGSHILVLSDKNAPAEEVMTVDNNSAGVIYYAAKGWIKFSNNAVAKQATGRGIRLDNNASLVYESGLADTRFTSGPSGGYDVRYWREAE